MNMVEVIEHCRVACGVGFTVRDLGPFCNKCWDMGRECIPMSRDESTGQWSCERGHKAAKPVSSRRGSRLRVHRPDMGCVLLSRAGRLPALLLRHKTLGAIVRSVLFRSAMLPGKMLVFM